MKHLNTMSEKHLRQLEKRIISKMMTIKNGDIVPKDSGVGTLMNLMRDLDEPLFEQLVMKYKKILDERK